MNGKPSIHDQVLRFWDRLKYVHLLGLAFVCLVPVWNEVERENRQQLEVQKRQNDVQRIADAIKRQEPMQPVARPAINSRGN